MSERFRAFMPGVEIWADTAERRASAVVETEDERSTMSTTTSDRVDVASILQSVLEGLYPGNAPWAEPLAKAGFKGLDRLTREQLRKQSSGSFNASEYERALRQVIAGLLDTSREQLRASAVREPDVADQTLVERANVLMEADGINPDKAEAEVVSGYYAQVSEELQAEAEPAEEPVVGEELDALAKVVLAERGWDATDPERYAAALQEAERLQVRGRRISEAKAVVARGYR
jgi:hypothetical protein